MPKAETTLTLERAIEAKRRVQKQMTGGVHRALVEEEIQKLLERKKTAPFGSALCLLQRSRVPLFTVWWTVVTHAKPGFEDRIPESKLPKLRKHVRCGDLFTLINGNGKRKYLAEWIASGYFDIRYRILEVLES